MEDLAPIVLFVYNRPEVTLRTLEALAKNYLAQDSVLYVYSDGPKENASEGELSKIQKVRDVVTSRRWCKELILKSSDKNLGLANSVIRGITEVVNLHGKIIVLEDDLITSKYFLSFLNRGLQMYEGISNVYAINAYMFSIDTVEVRTFLSPLATSTWGWATWANKWSAFEEKPIFKGIIQNNRFFRSRFNLADYNYADMLENKNSWGIRWYYSVFIRNGLGLFPTKSLCANIGFGVDATNTRGTIEQMNVHDDPIEVTIHDTIDIPMHEKLLNCFTRKKTPIETIFFRRIFRRRLI